MKKIKLTKLAASPNPKHETADWSEYKLGIENLKSPPIDYWIVGIMINNPLEIGQSMMVARESRNGIPVQGLFQSSPVTKIEEKEGKVLISTANSVYLMEYL